MKAAGMMFLGLAVLSEVASPAWGGDVREAVKRVLETAPYCSEGAAVWAPVKALRSQGFGDCEWVAAAGEMAEEELAVCSDGALLRELEGFRSKEDRKGEEGEERFRELEKRLKHARNRLYQLSGMLGKAEECQEEALCTVELIAKLSPGELFARPVCDAWVRLTLNADQSGRFAELGEWYLATQGADSCEFTWFCDALWRIYPNYRGEGGNEERAVARYLLSAAEKIRDPYLADRFDKCASGRGFSHGQPIRRGEPIRWLPGLEGWEGSLQRRRLAERFTDETDLRSRAAAELAADEKDLTDLREVYGAWASNDDATDTKSPLTDP